MHSKYRLNKNSRTHTLGGDSTHVEIPINLKTLGERPPCGEVYCIVRPVPGTTKLVP